MFLYLTRFLCASTLGTLENVLHRGIRLGFLSARLVCWLGGLGWTCGLWSGWLSVAGLVGDVRDWNELIHEQLTISFVVLWGSRDAFKNLTNFRQIPAQAPSE